MCGILLKYSHQKHDNFSIKFGEAEIKNLIDSEFWNSVEPNEALNIIQKYSEVSPCFDELRQRYNNDNEIMLSLVPKIMSRGPNFSQLHNVPAQRGSLDLFSAVLSLRLPFTEQPLMCEDFCLQFNGELYNVQEPNHNDTLYFFNRLKQHLNSKGDFTLEGIRSIVSEFEGEFSYTIYYAKTNSLFFGKDLCGKRSLFYSKSSSELYVSSLPLMNSEWHDCVGNQVYCADLNTMQISQITLHNDPFVVSATRHNKETHLDLCLDQLKSIFRESVSSRIKTIEPLRTIESLSDAQKSIFYVPPMSLSHPESISKSQTFTNSKFAVLFSGGLDCTLVAAVSAQMSPNESIDLLNVSFENKRTGLAPGSSPDRKLGLSSWKYLCKRFPNVNFNFIEVDVTYEEYLLGKQRVRNLMYPHNTEIDLSIEIAFFFASRGWGRKVIFNEEGNADEFERIDNFYSNCKVLLSGLGADELYGGYSRHDRLFNGILRKQESNFDTVYEQLKNELQHDISIIWTRNLSRDDKVVSSWGKELRYPFLSEKFVRYSCEHVPLNFKIYFDDTDKSKIILVKKFLLRQLATNLQLDFVSQEPKRAIQFGAKSAKMEPGQGRTKGSDKLK